ncbi:MAG: type II secretory pathway component GspD/PulD (secretin) [Alphaproteobacteria bacterium]|jgi:type II secretory pathway component GspD/PulD (secretin)
MRNMKNKFLAFTAALLVSACGTYYEEEVQPLSDREVEEYKQFQPTSSMRNGVFHMQRIGEQNSVRVSDVIMLKRPDLPPFDVAYISRNVETVILELANAAGESIVIPQGVRNRTVTVVHSGGDFQDMLEIILSKVGYHYNYIDGVWYVTRFPVRTYNLEIGQSDRAGSIVSMNEFSPEVAENSASKFTSEELDTKYTDNIWEQVEEAIVELAQVGNVAPAEGNASGGISPSGRFLRTNDTSGNDLFGDLTESGGLAPIEVENVASSDHLQPEEKAEPWYQVTRSAGLITVRAAPEAHRLIEEYLSQVQENSLKQIFVELRIIAVVKDKKTDRGADWDKSGIDLDDALSSVGFSPSTALNVGNAAGAVFSAATPSGDLGFVYQALSNVGSVHTVTSPSVVARNNQLSRVSLTKQLGYAETEVEQNTTSGGDVVIGTRTDKPKYKNAGTVLSVFPYIGKRKVQMRVRLSISNKSGDTAITTRVGDDDAITNQVPELTTNVIDQDMVVEYGRVYLISKIVEATTSADKDYIPGLADIPGLGEIMQRNVNSKEDTEFIVLLRVSRS